MGQEGASSSGSAEIDNDLADLVGCVSVNHTGRQTRPLVNVTSPAILAAVDAAEGTLTTGESSSVLANARRILNKAYQGEWVSC